MGLNIDVLRASMYRITGTDSDDAAQTLIDDCLNRSWWEVMAKLEFREKERTATFNFITGSNQYDVPDPFNALKSISVIDTNGKSSKLERVTSAWYAEVLDTDVTTNALPTHYFRENSTITVYPTPDASYVGTVRYTTTLADISDNVGIPVPQEWHEIVLYGGAWRLLLELGDFNRANELKSTQIALIKSTSPTEAQEESDSRQSGVEFIGSKYEL